MPETQEKKKLTVEFYRVEMPDNTVSFTKLVGKVASLPDDGKRTRKITGEPIRLACSSNWEGRVEGDMVHIRMGVLPLRVKLSGQAKKLDLDADEGLGAETAFLYDPKTRSYPKTSLSSSMVHPRWRKPWNSVVDFSQRMHSRRKF